MTSASTASSPAPGNTRSPPASPSTLRTPSRVLPDQGFTNKEGCHSATEPRTLRRAARFSTRKMRLADLWLLFTPQKKPEWFISNINLASLLPFDVTCCPFSAWKHNAQLPWQRWPRELYVLWRINQAPRLTMRFAMVSCITEGKREKKKGKFTEEAFIMGKGSGTHWQGKDRLQTKTAAQEGTQKRAIPRKRKRLK